MNQKRSSHLRPDKIPPALVAQRRDGGRMIIPVGGSMEQELILLRKTGDPIKKQSVITVRFVPMTGGELN